MMTEGKTMTERESMDSIRERAEFQRRVARAEGEPRDYSDNYNYLAEFHRAAMTDKTDNRVTLQCNECGRLD